MKEYSNEEFAIDLVADAYQTNDPIEIAKKCKEIVEVEVNISQIISYLNLDNSSINPFSINLKDIF